MRACLVLLLVHVGSVYAVGPAATESEVQRLRGEMQVKDQAIGQLQQALTIEKSNAAEATRRAEAAETSLTQTRQQLTAERARADAAEQQVATVQKELEQAQTELTTTQTQLHDLQVATHHEPPTMPPTRAERMFGGAMPGHRRCWATLRCPPDCTLSSPCASGSVGNQLYKNEFCDEFTGTQVCLCSRTFGAEDQVRFNAVRVALRPACPDSDAPTALPTMMPHEWTIATPQLENGWGMKQQPVDMGGFGVLPGGGNQPVKATPVAGVSGDPFTYAKDGTRVQFYLPLHKDMKLLACGDFTLFGSTRGSGIPGDTQQWFEQFRVLIDGDEKLSTGLRSMNAVLPARASGNLSTMTVAIEGNTIQQPMEVVYGSYNVDVAQRKVRLGRGSVEVVHFSSGGTTLEIKTALAAKEMEDEMQLRYIHLDLAFMALNSTACNSGILAEIWGNVAMSKATEALLQPPSQY